MKHLYVADPREHTFLVNEANRPGTITNILGSVLSMLPGFHKKKQNSTTHNSHKIEEQTPATPEASTIVTDSTINNRNSGKTEKEGNNIHPNTIETLTKNEVSLNNVMHQKDNNSDIVDFHSSLSPQNETHNCELSPIHTETMLQTYCTHNEMLNHYNCIVVGCFKEIFQGVDTNNLPAVLQALKEPNFILANRGPKLSAHYGFPLEPWQISAEEVPDCQCIPKLTH